MQKKLRHFKALKKTNPFVEWVVRNAYIIFVCALSFFGAIFLLIVMNWLTISAYINSYRLDAIYLPRVEQAYNNLLNLDEYAVRVISKQAPYEPDNELFAKKMSILETLRRLDTVPVDAQVKYFYMGMTKNDWETTVASMRAVTRIGRPALPYVLKMLKSGLPLFEYCSLCILAEIGDSSIADDILPFAYSKEPNILKKALWALDRTNGAMAKREAVVAILSSEDYREYDEELKEYSSRLLSKLSSPELDKRMLMLLEDGRPFEIRMAAGYLALSKDMQLVQDTFDKATEVFFEEDARLQFLNCLRDRRDDPSVQEFALNALKNPENGLGRYIANQILVLSKLDDDKLAQIKLLVAPNTDRAVAWDAAIVLCYQGDESSYSVLEEAIRSSSEFPELSRASRQAAIALGETQSNRALEILTKIANEGELVARIRAIQWGLRIYGINEGDWRMAAEAKVVYGVLKKIAEDVNEPLEVRGFANKAMQEIVTRPGATTGPAVVAYDLGVWRMPLFTGKGKHINELIRQNIGVNYFSFPPIDFDRRKEG